MAAVVITGGQLHWRYHVELFNDRHLRPDADIPGVGRRLVLPRSRPNSAQRNRGRSRAAFPSARRSRERSLFRAAGSSACRRAGGRADDNHPIADHRRCVQSEFAGFEIDFCRSPVSIDDAVLAEQGDPLPRLRVEGDQVARRDVDDALLLAVAPVGHAAA